MLQYIFESWVWSIGGLAVGYMVGRTEREIHNIKSKLEEREEDDDTREPS